MPESIPPTVAELRKQYQDLAQQCTALGRTLPGAELNRVAQGGPVRLSPGGAKFKELMELKRLAWAELQTALDIEQTAQERQLQAARQLLENAGRLAPRGEMHTDQTSLPAE